MYFQRRRYGNKIIINFDIDGIKFIMEMFISEIVVFAFFIGMRLIFIIVENLNMEE